MRAFKCPQCGAQPHDGKACAERLYDLLLWARQRGMNYLEIAARFALNHPATHSQECLEFARQYLGAEPHSAAVDVALSIAAAAKPGANSGNVPGNLHRPEVSRGVGRSGLCRRPHRCH